MFPVESPGVLVRGLKRLLIKCRHNLLFKAFKIILHCYTGPNTASEYPHGFANLEECVFVDLIITLGAAR